MIYHPVDGKWYKFGGHNVTNKRGIEVQAQKSLCFTILVELELV